MRYRLALLGSLLLPVAWAGGGPQTGATVADIAAAQIQTLADFEREIDGWQIEYEVKGYGTDGDLVRQAKYARRVKPGGLLLSTEVAEVDKTSGGGGVDTAAGKNGYYRFALQKKVGSTDWVLRNASRAEEPGSAKWSEQSVSNRRTAGAWYSRHFYGGDRRLYADVITDKQFVIKSCETSPSNPEWLRVVGELPASGGKGQDKPALSGWWDFDPANGCCCRATNLTEKYQGYSTVERLDFDASRRERGLITLDRHAFNGHADYSGTVKNQSRGEWTFRYTHDMPPDEAFTLSAFGLPEPYFAPQPRSYLWVYLALAAVVAAAIAWRLARRTGRQASG